VLLCLPLGKHRRCPITKSEIKILNKRPQFTYLDGTLRESSFDVELDGYGVKTISGKEVKDFFNCTEDTAALEAKLKAMIQ